MPDQNDLIPACIIYGKPAPWLLPSLRSPLLSYAVLRARCPCAVPGWPKSVFDGEDGKDARRLAARIGFFSQSHCRLDRGGGTDGGRVNGIKRQQPAPNNLLGKQVVQKDSRLYLATRSSGFNPQRVTIYRVTQVNGTQLQVDDGRYNGFTQTDRVIPLENALEYFTQEIRAHPQNAFGYVARGKVLAWQGEFDRALADFNEAIRLTPDDPWNFAHRGAVWNIKHEYDKAIADYGETLRLNPKDYEACVGRGDAWLQKSELDKAIADYDLAIKLVKKDPKPRDLRGRAFFFKNETDKAIADFTDAIQLKPEFADAFRERGNVYAYKADFDKAIFNYDHAIRLNPKDANAYLLRGNVLVERKELDKAIADYKLAIELDPKYAFSYYARGRAWSIKNEYDKAIDDFNQAIALMGDLAVAFRDRGNAWNMKGEYSKAHADLRHSMELYPTDPLTHTIAARISATCPVEQYRSAKLAVSAGKSACELTEWKDPTTIDVLAAAYAESNDFDSAVKWQSKAIELQTDEKIKAEYSSRLKLYQAKKPYREPSR